MEFPITDLLSREQCMQWIVEHFHRNNFGCKHCGAGVEEARKFRTTHRSQLTVYRCRRCDQTLRSIVDFPIWKATKKRLQANNGTSN